MKSLLIDCRCVCGKLLLKGIVFDGLIEIKCKHCGKINSIGDVRLTSGTRCYLLIFNENGLVVNVTDSACCILGYARDELIGKPFTQINPTMPSEIGKKFFSVLRMDNFFHLDTIHQAKDGKKISVTVFLKLYQPTSNKRYALVCAELKNDESCQELPEQNIVEFLGEACDFYFDIDRNGTILYMSESCEKLFGFTQEDCIGKNFLDISLDELTKEKKKTFEHFSALNAPFREEDNIVKDKYGNTINTELYFAPIFDDIGKFIGYRVLGWMKKES